MKEQRLLIIHQGSLGDFILTFPAITLLKKKIHCIDAICQNNLGKLAVELNVIEKWFPLEAASFASLYSAAIEPAAGKILRSYHHIILFSFSAALEATLKKVAGRSVCRIPPRPDLSQRIHVTRHILSHLTRYEPFKTDKEQLNRIELPLEHFAKKEKRLRSATILIHPGSGSRKKNWSISNFLKIEVSLRSSGLKPEFIIGPAETFLLEILQQDDRQKRVVHIIDELPDLASRLNTAGGLIGNDSGVSHLAAFMGIPTVAVFGPSDPERWKPVGRAVKAVRPALECSPCFETEGIGDCEHMECLDKTSPETVLKAFYRLLGR